MRSERPAQYVVIFEKLSRAAGKPNPGSAGIQIQLVIDGDSGSQDHGAVEVKRQSSGAPTLAAGPTLVDYDRMHGAIGHGWSWARNRANKAVREIVVIYDRMGRGVALREPFYNPAALHRDVIGIRISRSSHIVIGIELNCEAIQN